MGPRNTSYTLKRDSVHTASFNNLEGVRHIYHNIWGCLCRIKGLNLLPGLRTHQIPPPIPELESPPIPTLPQEILYKAHPLLSPLLLLPKQRQLLCLSQEILCEICCVV